MTNRVRRAIATVAVTTFLVAAAAGCSPAEPTRIGLHLVDGRVEALIYLCPYNTFIKFGVYSDDSNSGRWDVRAPLDGPRTPPEPIARDLRLNVFDNNEGLQAVPGGLTSFENGHTYAAGAAVSPRPLTLGDFTADDLAKTDAGHVITGRQGEVERVSIAEFEKRSDDDCHPRQ